MYQTIKIVFTDSFQQKGKIMTYVHIKWALMPSYLLFNFLLKCINKVYDITSSQKENLKHKFKHLKMLKQM